MQVKDLIRAKMDELNDAVCEYAEQAVQTFVLNPTMIVLNAQIENVQEECRTSGGHLFDKDGYCIYCDRRKDNE